MTTFDDRERAFEAKYRMDQETAFKVNVRRDKLVGLWLAGMMGLEGQDALAYARSVIEADMAEPGDDDVVAKLMADIRAKRLGIEEERLRDEMDRQAELARKQIVEELRRGA